MMNKEQAVHSFWSGFGIPAYSESEVPDNVQYPYITYSMSTDSLDNVVTLTASLWYYGTSWEDVSLKTNEIAEFIVTMNPPSMPLNNGRLYLSKGTPFAQRMEDPDDKLIRRVYLMLQAEFLTAY